jgi:pheromone shutdown-related protein TraB
MQTVENITLIGTSHISKDSIKEIKSFIEDEKPDIIGIELDMGRLRALFKEEKFSYRSIFQVGLTGFVFALIGRFAQKKLGEIVGIKPGSDMKTAVKLAKKNKIKIALIDQEIGLTLARFSRYFSWKEKWQVVKDFFSALIGRGDIVKFDLRKVPSDTVIKNLLEEVKRKYPNVYRVLVVERNHVMANMLYHISQKEPEKKILGVVGAGHIEGMVKILRSKKWDKLEGSSYSFGYSL